MVQSLTMFVLEYEVPDGTSSVWINAGCGLIQDYCAGSSDKRYGNGELAFHAARQTVNGRVTLVQKTKVTNHPVSVRQLKL